MPKQQDYDSLEVDEFRTCAGNKKHKVWLVYAYHRGSGKIVAYVWGKRNFKTTHKLRNKLLLMNISYDVNYRDKWDSFTAVFRQTITFPENKTRKE